MAQQKKSVISLRPYLDIVHRHRLLAVCVFIIGLAITALLTLMLPPTYQSDTLVLIEPQQVSQSYVSETQNADITQRLRQLSEQALSRTRLQPLVNQLNLYPKQRAQKQTMDEILDTMRQHVSILLLPDQTNAKPSAKPIPPDSFRVSFQYPDPGTAQKVATAIADIFIDENLKSRIAQASAASEFIDDQLSKAKASLSQKENELKAFKSKHAGALPHDLDGNLKLQERIEDQLARADAAMEAAKAQSPEAKRSELEAKLVELQSLYSDKHPDVVQMKAAIEALKKEGLDLAASPRSRTSVIGTRATMSALEAARAKLQAQLAVVQSRIAETPQNEAQLEALSRDYEVQTKAYQKLLDNKNAAAMAENLEQRQEGERFAVLDPANFPTEAAFPNYGIVAGVGAALSLFFALGIPFAVYFTDTSFKDPDELSAEYEAPVAAAIPEVQRAESRGARRWVLIRAGLASSATISVGAVIIWYVTNKLM